VSKPKSPLDLALEELLRDGMIEMGPLGKDGQPRFHLTEKGMRDAEKLIATDPEMAKRFSTLTKKHFGGKLQ